MTLIEYNRLSEKQRNLTLRTRAVFVAASYNKHYEFKLFMLDSFYIEVIYKVDGTLCGSRAFTAVYQLDRYLNTIDLSPLRVS